MLGDVPSAPPPENVLPDGVAVRFADGALRLSLTQSIYSLEAVLRSCYWLTDRCYVHLSQPNPGSLEITFLAKAGNQPETNEVAWLFLNDLIDQQLRISIQADTAPIRNTIVAQAFADVDLIDDRGRPLSERTSDPNNEQERILNWRPVS